MVFILVHCTDSAAILMYCNWVVSWENTNDGGKRNSHSEFASTCQ
uniref:Uncharacterized protein n=1 Tax=Arundo donax TaxID=35708 RepID=A0A0A9GL46_ARUDO